MVRFSKKMFISLVFLCATTSVFANPVSSAEFFASNNTQEITVQTAYARLTGQEQIDLNHAMLSVLKRYHITAGKSGSLLGAYRMSTDKELTADNTEYVYSENSQPLSDKKIFTVAKTLAISLHQDSVAVLIPNNTTTVGDITVRFVSGLPRINQAIQQVHEKLPALYSQGFSLHVVNTQDGFEHAKVSEIEWLGSKVNLNEIKKAFPDEKISAQDGTAYLIYQNGKEEKL